jgi:hypothetical protein
MPPDVYQGAFFVDYVAGKFVVNNKKHWFVCLQ